MLIRRSRLAANSSAATTPSTPKEAPTIEDRTGTAPRPASLAPGRNRCRSPSRAAIRPAMRRRSEVRGATTPRRSESSPPARPARPPRGPFLRARRSPRPSTNPSTSKPRAGSASRATPIGKSGDTTAANEHRDEAATDRDRQAKRPKAEPQTWRRRNPSARRMSCSEAIGAMWRASAERDRDETRQRRNTGKDPQADRRDIDRALRARALDREAQRRELFGAAEDPPRRRDDAGNVSGTVRGANAEHGSREAADLLAVLGDERDASARSPRPPRRDPRGRAAVGRGPRSGR